ncbi:MAG: beta-ketoacyl-ACP synthase II [Vampirovibrio sp.]
MTLKRVVVTGMGSVSPMGKNNAELWTNVEAGRSGIRFIEVIPEGRRTCRVAGEIVDFDPETYIDKKKARRMDRFTQLGLTAALQAYEDSGIEGHVEKHRMGVVVGTGSGGLITMEETVIASLEKGYHRTSPFLVPMMIPDMACGRISIELGITGPNFALVTACATGTDCIGQAVKMIQTGECDAVVAGGAEAPITAVAVAGFNNMKALTGRNDDPQRASRPFDKDRDGFVISEGAGILILEDYEIAKARGAKIYAEIVGYGRSSDAFDIVMPHSEGLGASRAMVAALRSAELEPEQLNYINAHGTSTPLGDVAETIAIKRVFGDYAKNGLLVSSTKSMHGHMLGATGAIEAIICIQALLHQTVPPTINLDNPDEACDLDYVPHTARQVNDFNYAMSNSFGFGGHNSSLILKRFQD